MSEEKLLTEKEWKVQNPGKRHASYIKYKRAWKKSQTKSEAAPQGDDTQQEEPIISAPTPDTNPEAVEHGEAAMMEAKEIKEVETVGLLDNFRKTAVEAINGGPVEAPKKVMTLAELEAEHTNACNAAKNKLDAVVNFIFDVEAPPAVGDPMVQDLMVVRALMQDAQITGGVAFGALKKEMELKRSLEEQKQLQAAAKESYTQHYSEKKMQFEKFKAQEDTRTMPKAVTG